MLILRKKTQILLDDIQKRTSWFIYIFCAQTSRLLYSHVSYILWINSTMDILYGAEKNWQGLAWITVNGHAYTTASPRLDEIEPGSEKRAIFCLWCVEQKVLQRFQFCHFPVTPGVRAKCRMEMTPELHTLELHLVHNGGRLSRCEGWRIGKWMAHEQIHFCDQSSSSVLIHYFISWSVYSFLCLPVSRSCVHLQAFIYEELKSQRIYKK